jgi:hypothetical protein
MFTETYGGKIGRIYCYEGGKIAFAHKWAHKPETSQVIASTSFGISTVLYSILKHDVSDTGFCPRLQMEASQLCPADRDSLGSGGRDSLSCRARLSVLLLKALPVANSGAEVKCKVNVGGTGGGGPGGSIGEGTSGSRKVRGSNFGPWCFAPQSFPSQAPHTASQFVCAQSGQRLLLLFACIGTIHII